MASTEQDWTAADQEYLIPLGDGTRVSPSQFSETNVVITEAISQLAGRFEREAQGLLDAYSTLSARLASIFPDAAGDDGLVTQDAPRIFLHGDCNNGYYALWGQVSKSISDLIDHVQALADDPNGGLYEVAQTWFDSMQATLRSCGGLQAPPPAVPLSPQLTDDGRPH